jgi:S-(hydroxymethyl)glutathione dehydrogenase/alcohol dehydrogenase
MMLQTLAAVVYEHNKPVVVETVNLDPPKSGEVLLRMAAAGVCHSDLSVVSGTIYYDPPVVLGHEGAAIVEEVGPDVTYVEPGDHVILSFATSCGECAICKMGYVVLCTGIDARPGYLLDDTCRMHNAAGRPLPQMARIGTMSEYAVVSERSLIKIDKHYPLDKAVLVGCGVTTGVGAAMNTAQIQPGDKVAVIGTGGVGLNVVQGAALAGAAQIIAVDVEDRKLEFASSFGATDAVNPNEGDPVEAVMALTGGIGVDYAIEVIGNTKTIEQAYGMVRRHGTVVVVGMDRNDKMIQTPAQDIVRTEKRLIGSYYGSSNPRKDMPRLLELYDEGKIKLDELITRTYRLDQINQAFTDLKAGTNARGVITFE